MENQLELIEWFKKMGYDGKMANSLGHICNKSTSFIWDELIQNARPKQEVDKLRNNVIINRLRSKQLNEQDQYSYPVKEIELYIKNQYLTTKMNNLSSSVRERKLKLNNISQSNKMKYITIEKLRSRIKENEEREYLLNKKCATLERDIRDTEETLVLARNLTPVELEENPNTKEITETLEKCVERLEKLFPEIPRPNNQLNSVHKSMKFHSVQKQPKTVTNFERYLIASEKKHSQIQSVLNCGGPMRKDQINKENLGSDRKINKKLFDTSNEQGNKTKRESLGLLPDSCFKYNNEDNFLVAPESVPVFLSPPLSSPKEISIIKACTSKSENSDLRFGSFLSDRHNSEISTQTQGYPCHARKHVNFEKLYNDDFVTKSLKNLLYNHNRHIIWKTFQTLNDNLNLEFTKYIISEGGNNGKNSSICMDDIAKLQFLHIRQELQTMKLKAFATQLSNKVAKKKKSVYGAIISQGAPVERIPEVERLLERQLEDVGLDVVLAEMKKEINSAKKIEDSTDLQVTSRKILQVKDDINYKIVSIRYYVDGIDETLKSMVRTRETTVACVRKLGPFIEDLSWSLPLTQSLCSKETKAFEHFPLEYNRRCIYTDPRIYYRDIGESIPADVELDSESLYMLTNVLESPFNPPETVLLNLLKSKMKLDALKSLPKCSNVNITKHSLQELQAQEHYLQYALEKFNSLLNSAPSNKALATADLVIKVMELWLEMPMRNFISPDRLVEGKEYKYYERQFDKFYNNF